MIRREPIRRKRDKKPNKSSASKGRGNAIADTLAEFDRLEAASPQVKSLIELFRGWLTDESGYDEETWPKLKRALDRERARVGARGIFDA